MFLLCVMVLVEIGSSVCGRHASSVGREAALAEAGVSAECLAAAGLNAEQACAFADLIKNASDERAASQAAALSVDSAVREIDAAEKELAKHPGDDALQSQVRQLRTGYDTSTAQLALARGALLQVGLSATDPEVSGRVTRYIAHRPYELSPELRVLPWSDGEMRRLVRASRAERVAAKANVALDDGAATLLRDARLNPAVVSAKQSLDANLAQVKGCLRE